LKRGFYILLLITVAGLLFPRAQPVIGTIELEGLEKTRPAFIHHFIALKSGDRYDSLIAQQIRQTLVNLPILSDAKLEIREKEDTVNLVYQLVENQSLLPIFNFGWVREVFWIQAGATEINLAGRGHQFNVFYQLYDRHSVAADLTLNRFRFSDFSYRAEFVKWSTVEPLFFQQGTATYHYDNYTYGLGAIYHLNYFDQLEVGTSYFEEHYRLVNASASDFAPTEALTRKMLFKTIYQKNDLNYHFFYLEGIFNQLIAQTVISFDGEPEFHIFWNDFQWYKRIGTRGNLAARTRFGLSTNRDSPFAPFVLDSYVNIRGVGNRVDRGTGTLVQNLEYRHTLIEGSTLALQGVGFVDIGGWRLPGGAMKQLFQRKTREFFSGIGFRLIHKRIFNGVLRVDYGLDLEDEATRGFVIGLGQYF
jgi:outer membrane protein assembly factor BamA